MDLMATGHADTVYARRLAALLDHMRVTAAEFSSLTGLTQDYISKVLSGERGRGSKPLLRLHIATERTLGVGGHYWTAESDVPPEKAYRSRSTAGGDLMAVITGAQTFGGQRVMGGNVAAANVAVRNALAAFAAERDESGEMIKELMRVQPPEDADVLWWIQTWVKLSERHPKPGH